MQSLVKVATRTTLLETLIKTQFISTVNFKPFSTKPSAPNRNPKNADDEWNDAWETAWLPPDPPSENGRAPWETDENLSPAAAAEAVVIPSDADPETKVFVEDMNANWDE